jgi:prophage regulatory protein
MMKEEKKRRILRKPELQSMIGLSDASIWRLEKQNRFPKRIRLGGQSVGWFSDEIENWFDIKAKERR